MPAMRQLPFVKQSATCLLLNSVLALSVADATCGGGGGGGRGGVMPGGRSMSSSSGGTSTSTDSSSSRQSSDSSGYRVSWAMNGPSSVPLSGSDSSLMLLWFPTSSASIEGSGLLTSRILSLAGGRCVAETMVTSNNLKVRESYHLAAGDEVVVLTSPDGKEIARVAADTQGINVRAVEKLLNTEISNREKQTEALLKAAEDKVKNKDKSAVDALQKVWAQRCLFPSLGKRAAKALKKLGVAVEQASLDTLGSDDLADTDIQNTNTEVAATIAAGLNAELSAHYEEAAVLYKHAVALDPADPTALRYLGEFYRHQTGQWDLAGKVFHKILAQPSDPIAQAVALHGLGKMTIHAGRFKEGLALFERSLAAYPLPITYRNLAVYWFSEKEPEKAAGYMRQALALDPDDLYNQIFAAVYLAAAGHRDEALVIAKKNESVLEASYNLAAIWAQAGDRAKAMELLRRQFYQYERYAAVRGMEMKEAREDYMFASLHRDPAFIELTKDAKNAWMIGAEFCTPDQLEPVTALPGPRKM